MYVLPLVWWDDCPQPSASDSSPPNLGQNMHIWSVSSNNINSFSRCDTSPSECESDIEFGDEGLDDDIELECSQNMTKEVKHRRYRQKVLFRRNENAYVQISVTFNLSI